MTADKLKNIRMQLNLTQKDLGVRLFPDVVPTRAQAKISQYETRRLKISRDVEQKILNLVPRTLVGNDFKNAYETEVPVTPKADTVLLKMLAQAKLDTYKARIQSIQYRIMANDYSGVETW